MGTTVARPPPRLPRRRPQVAWASDRQCQPNAPGGALRGVRPRRARTAAGARRPRAQPQERLPGPAPGLDHRLHRAVRVGQVVAGVRHHLRRGAAALRRVAVRVRPPVPGPDGQAGRGLHRRAEPGGLHRPEVDQPQPALDRGHGHGGLRLPAPALRPDRPPALPGLRPRDQPADAAADRGPDPAAAGGDQVPGARARGAAAQGRVHRPVRRAAGRRVLPRPGGRCRGEPGRAAGAEEAGEARHQRRRGPAGGQGGGQAAGHRFRRDGAAAGRRHRPAGLRRPAG